MLNTSGTLRWKSSDPASRACLSAACYPFTILHSPNRHHFLHVLLPWHVVQQLLWCIHLPVILPLLPFYLKFLQRLRILKNAFNNLGSSFPRSWLGLTVKQDQSSFRTVKKLFLLSIVLLQLSFPPSLFRPSPLLLLLLLLASTKLSILSAPVRTNHSTILACVPPPAADRSSIANICHCAPLSSCSHNTHQILVFSHDLCSSFTPFPQAFLS